MKARADGSIVLLIPQNMAEVEWLEANTDAEDYQWLGAALAVEWRYAADILSGVKDAGFPVEEDRADP